MPIARNDKGEFLTLGDDGQWSPATIATNPGTGEKLLRDGASWVPVPAPERPTGEKISRGIGITGSGVNESLATTLGAVPDLVGAGMRAVGLPSSQPGFYTDLARKGINSIGTLGGLLPDAPKPENTTEKALYGAGKGIGDAASVLVPATAIARTAQAGGMASELGKVLAAQPGAQLASGAVGGAVGEATDSPAAGLVASLVTPVVMSGVARSVRPIRPDMSPERQRLLGVAREEGIPLTAGQETGSRALKNVEGAFDNLPFTAGRAEADRQAQQTAFNRASLARSGTDADVATPEVLRGAQARIGGKIGEIADRNTLNAMQPEFRQDLVDLVQDSSRNATPDTHRLVVNRIKDVLSKITDGEMPGRAYREMDTELGAAIKEAATSQKSDLSNRLIKLRTSLRNAMDNSISPEDAADWQEARRQYANYKVSQNAASGAGEASATGNISPLRLKSAVESSIGKDNYALGGGDQNDLARVGQLLRLAPDSGTAGRAHMQGLLTGGLAGGSGAGGLAAALMGADPMTAAVGAGSVMALPKLLQSAYLSKPVQEYFRHGIPKLAPLAEMAPQLNRPLVAALLGQEVNDAIPGQRRIGR